jgi:hypothetical protein
VTGFWLLASGFWLLATGAKNNEFASKYFTGAAFIVN